MTTNNKASLQSILASSAKMAVATFTSRVLGLMREQALAMVFGASRVTDAFLVAYRIPNLLRDLFAEGAFSAAFVPTFTEVHLKDPQKARELLWGLFVLLSAITSVISLLFILFAPEMVGAFAPSYKESPELFNLCVLLTRVMSPFLVFISLAALMMGALNTLKVFFLPSLAPAIFNVCALVSTFFFPALFESWGYPGALALGVGVIIGGFFQALVQFIPLVKLGYGPCPLKEIYNDYSRRILKLMSVGLIGFAATQINLLVTTVLASGAGPGAVSWLNYAFRLFQFPVGILSVSIAGSNLVHFSNAWKRGDEAEAMGLLKMSMDLSMLLVIPCMSCMLAFGDIIVHLIYEHGQFMRSDTLATSEALAYYALGLPFYGLYKILAPTFYTLGKQKVPILSSLASISMNIIFCMLLVPRYGFGVLALGTTLSMMINSMVLCIVLCTQLKVNWRVFLHLKILKILLSGAVVLGVMSALKFELFSYRESFTLRCLSLLSLFGVSGVVYLLSLMLLGEGNFLLNAWGKIKRKVKK